MTTLGTPSSPVMIKDTEANGFLKAHSQKEPLSLASPPRPLFLSNLLWPGRFELRFVCKLLRHAHRKQKKTEAAA